MGALTLENGGVIYGVEKKEHSMSPRKRNNTTTTISPSNTDSDRVSMMTRASSRSEGARTNTGTKTRSGSVTGNGVHKMQPKARAHEAPVYASRSPCSPFYSTTED